MSTVMERNHITIVGEGEQTLVLAHGLGCNQKMWKYVLPYFEKDYKVILFDHVGSGASDLHAYQSEKYQTLQGYAMDLLEILETLQLDDVIFVGHSVSSMIGMLAAIKRPELFKHLIMVGPSPCYLNEEGYRGGFDKSDIEELLDMMEMNFAGWAGYLAPVGMHSDNPEELAKELEAAFISCDPRIAREFAEVTFFSDCREKLSALRVPTLILQCSEDSIVPLEIGHFLQAHIQGSELYVLPAKGHYPHISQPEETATKIKLYLQH